MRILEYSCSGVLLIFCKVSVDMLAVLNWDSLIWSTQFSTLPNASRERDLVFELLVFRLNHIFILKCRFHLLVKKTFQRSKRISAYIIFMYYPYSLHSLSNTSKFVLLNPIVLQLLTFDWSPSFLTLDS